MTAMLDSWPLILPLVLGVAAIYWLMPTAQGTRPKIVAALLGIAALAILAGRLTPALSAPVAGFMTSLFGLSAVSAAALMVTNRNPVYAALWFAIVTLSVCGLFLMQSAPFLAAATIIVYAGAIIVTFLFVIALAQQAGATIYDQRARQPFMATVAAFVLLGGMLFALGKGPNAIAPQGEVPAGAVAKAGAPVEAPKAAAIGTLRGLGRLMFTDYLYSVEIAGTLLLVATIGAIAIAPRRSHGAL